MILKVIRLKSLQNQAHTMHTKHTRTIFFFFFFAQARTRRTISFQSMLVNESVVDSASDSLEAQQDRDNNNLDSESIPGTPLSAHSAASAASRVSRSPTKPRPMILDSGSPKLAHPSLVRVHSPKQPRHNPRPEHHPTVCWRVDLACHPVLVMFGCQTRSKWPSSSHRLLFHAFPYFLPCFVMLTDMMLSADADDRGSRVWFVRTV